MKKVFLSLLFFSFAFEAKSSETKKPRVRSKSAGNERFLVLAYEESELANMIIAGAKLFAENHNPAFNTTLYKCHLLKKCENDPNTSLKTIHKVTDQVNSDLRKLPELKQLLRSKSKKSELANMIISGAELFAENHNPAFNTTLYKCHLLKKCKNDPNTSLKTIHRVTDQVNSDLRKSPELKQLLRSKSVPIPLAPDRTEK